MRAVGEKHLVVSHRNLVSLLAKLDGHPPESYCTIVGGDEADGWVLTAEVDQRHYAHRPPGWMHEDTEAAIE